MPETKNSLLDYIKPWKLLPSLMEAFKKAKESKDKSFFEKIGIFWSSFKKEMKGIKQEKKKVSAETNKAVEKSVDETTKDVREATELEENTSEEEKNSFDEFLSMGIDNFKSLDKTNQAHFVDGFKKIEEQSENLSFEEVSATAAVGLMTLSQLKKTYPKKDDFKKNLEKLLKASTKSKYPLKKLMGKNVLSLFKLDQDEGIKFLEAFGINIGAADFFGKIGIGSGGEASKAKELLGQISKKNMDKKDELVKFMKKYIFKNTSENNISKAVEMLNSMVNGSKVDSEVITELVFTIDDQDYKHIVTALVGKTNLKIV